MNPSDNPELPANWMRTALGAVVEEKVSQSGPTVGGDFSYVDIGSIDNRTKRITELKSLPRTEAPSRAKQVLATGDVLVSMTRPNLNAVAMVPSELNQAIGSTGFDVLRTRIVEPSWLFYTVQSSDFVRAMCQVVQGALYPAVRPRDIRSYSIPLPPRGEQRRIVAKIEELFSELDAGVAALQRVRANLKRYRAAVLKAAVEGKLTAAWRAANRHSPSGRGVGGEGYEPASKLLERILAEHRRRWEADQLAKYAASDKPPPKNWQAKYAEPSSPDTTNLPELPEGWCWATIDSFAFVTKLAGFEFTKYVRYDPDGDLPVIKAENAGKLGFKPTEFSRIHSESVAELKRSWLFGGEVLMVFVGAGVGKVAIVPNDQRYFLGPNIAMIRIDGESVLPVYLESFLRSPIGFSLSIAFTKAVAQPSLSMGTIRQIPVALPTLAEQHQIVADVEQRLSVLAATEAEIDASLVRAARLRQSILKRAFAGRLVPQDLRDEPASVLLERIRSDNQHGHQKGNGHGK